MSSQPKGDAVPECSVGARLPQRENDRLLRGRGVYIDDLRLPGTLVAHFLRSPHAHARIEKVSTGAALKMPGVEGVWTAADLGARIRPLRAVLNDPAYRETAMPALAAGKVRFVGEPVAVVVAADRYLAEDAADSIAVEYTPLVPLADVAAALRDREHRVHEELADNILFECDTAGGDIERAFREADLRLARTFQHPRSTGLAIENRGVLAQYEPARGLLTVWSSTQVPDILRKALAACLAHPQHKLRVVAPDVGGGFGVKMHVFPEELVVAHLARELGRPVKWTEDRVENLLASIHARDHVLEAEIAARRDGTILGLRVRDFCDAGAYSAYPITAALEPLTCASALPGPYRIENYDFRSVAVATNKCPIGAYRGVGFALCPVVTETLMDLVARELGMDPAEIRRRNFIPPEAFPYTSSAGTVYDSGNFPRAFERALEAADYRGFRDTQRQARAEGRFVGVGLSSFVEPTGMGRRVYGKRGMAQVPAFDSATVKVDPSGTVRAYLSTPSQGQGMETCFAQMLADELGVPFESVAVFLGDTEVCPSGNGTFASRSIVSAGSALLLAARSVRSKLLALAGHRLSAAPEELEISAGRAFLTRQPERGWPLAELVQALYSPTEGIPEGLSPGLEVTQSFSLAGAAVSAGTHVVTVEVDAETGFVRVLRYVAAEDCGRVINPALVDGQIRGGIAQGIGAALYENLAYDEQGQCLTASLMDYLVPGATEVPVIEIEHLETLSPLTPGGSKGVGESGLIASPAAISNAIADALAPFGVSFTRLPITPPDIVAALRESSERAAGKKQPA
jgi:aerobic carbon-monoxide dehydrogenase large subunit